MTQLRTILLVVLCLALCRVATRAEEDNLSPILSDDLRKLKEEIAGPLGGLEGVAVRLDVFGAEELQKAGVSKSQLKDDVHTRLREARIPILSTQESERMPGRPSLYVWVYLYTPGLEQGYCPFVIGVEFTQDVRLARNDLPVPRVSTYRTQSIGGKNPQDLRDLREQVGADVGKFVDLYLTANPINTSKIEQKKENE